MLYYIFQHRASFGQELIGDIYYFVAKMDEEVLREPIQDPKSYAKMKLNGIGDPAIGDIRNIIISGNLLKRIRIRIFDKNRIIQSFLEPICFFVKSCENENESGCEDGFGDKILVLRNQEKVSEIPEGKFHNYEECFATVDQDTFEFHAGGLNGVSY